jgi:hypothetical protein
MTDDNPATHELDQTGFRAVAILLAAVSRHAGVSAPAATALQLLLKERSAAAWTKASEDFAGLPSGVRSSVCETAEDMARDARSAISAMLGALSEISRRAQRPHSLERDIRVRQTERIWR